MKNIVKFSLFFFILLIILAACFVPCILQDPYNVFHVNNVRDNGIEPNKNYIKMTYIKSNPQKFDAFMFGSSLTGMINAQNVPNTKCYNMSHSGGLASESFENLKTLIDSGILPKEIILGLEPISFSDSIENRKNDRMRCPYEYSKNSPVDFWCLYLSPKMNIEANRIIRQYKPMDSEYQAINKDVFYNNGGYPFYGYTWNYDREEAKLRLKTIEEEYSSAIKEGSLSEERPQYMDEALDSIREIVVLCKANNIKLTVFTNPIFYETFSDAVINLSYLDFLKELAQITPYYNFSGFNRYSTDLSYYHEDKTHFLVELGDIMLDVMCKNNTEEIIPEQGFGMYVTEQNIDELVKILSNIG